MQLKSFILVVTCSVISIVATANSADTTRPVVLAMNTAAPKNVTILKAANVIYPEMLEGQQGNFIPYVEQFSEKRRTYLIRTYTKAKNFFPKAKIIFKKYGVPEEFLVLMALESAFNGNAVSTAGAVGYWQIMDDVAKEFGLKIITGQKKGTVVKAKPVAGKNKKPLLTDDRKNFSKSTHAAARYLKDRLRNLDNDWLLVAASYNWGVGNVWKAMERAGKANPTFWDIKDKLPAETRAYVMNFIALNVLFKNYENFHNDDLCFKDIMLQNE